MALISDFLKSKKLQQAKEMIAYAKQNNFYLSLINQTDETIPRIILTIYPEGKQENIFLRVDKASWYFYTDENSKEDFGTMADPSSLRSGGKTFKNFKIFMRNIREKFERHKKQSSLRKIAIEIVKKADNNILNKILKEINKLKKLQKMHFDISTIDLEEIQKFVKKIEKMGYWTYVSSGTLAVQKSNK